MSNSAGQWTHSRLERRQKFSDIFRDERLIQGSIRQHGVAKDVVWDVLVFKGKAAAAFGGGVASRGRVRLERLRRDGGILRWSVLEEVVEREVRVGQQGERRGRGVQIQIAAVL